MEMPDRADEIVGALMRCGALRLKLLQPAGNHRAATALRSTGCRIEERTKHTMSRISLAGRKA